MSPKRVLAGAPTATGSGCAACRNVRISRASRLSLLPTMSSSSSSASAIRTASSSLVPSSRNSWYRSSRCCASSSITSRSRAGRSDRRASRAASRRFQSGMFGPRDELNRLDELAPVITLRGEHLAAFCRQPIKAPAALARLLDPSPRDPAALFEPVEERIERGHLELQPPAGSLLDQLADLVAMPCAGLDQRKDQQLGAAFLHLAIEHPGYMLHSDILHKSCQLPTSNSTTPNELPSSKP